MRLRIDHPRFAAMLGAANRGCNQAGKSGIAIYSAAATSSVEMKSSISSDTKGTA